MLNKPLVYGVGIGFDPCESSCGRHAPQTFRWTTDPLANKVATVYVDFGMLQAPAGGGAIGWLSESSAVAAWLVRQIVDDISLRDRFKIIYTHDKRLLELFPHLCRFCPNGSNLPWVDPVDHKFAENRKTHVASIIASEKTFTPGHQLRHRLVRELPTTVHRFGKSANNYVYNKADALAPYMFSFAIENDRYDRYYTEKLLDCFATKTIPIYYGCPSESLRADGWDVDGVAWLNEANVEDINAFLEYAPKFYEENRKAIEHNYCKVQDLQMADDFLFEKIRDLCWGDK